MNGFTEDEGRTLRTAVYGAMVLVSVADEGAVDEESHAGIRAMSALPPQLRQVVGAAPPELPVGTVADVEHGVLTALRASADLLAARSAGQARAFADAVLAMCGDVASADGTVGRAEDVVVARIRSALDAAL
ncbi:hypothetical protein GCM10022243_57870 [Saccharothrix violaceirubra]|uniref:Tellurite resistance protein n=1 Tax=Saccharothrix violaceirubra TaxID=413306 RepID=A0A7W7T3E3_9PSEU|nr:hypothetical protein [Saccharothrix violaceirubra]MBB4965781.1 tellurite resistance protein [Saccharothrix violaceirubra]